MEFTRKTVVFTILTHKRNEEIKKLIVEALSKFIQNYHVNCKDHIERKDYNRIANKLLHCRPHGKRKPRKNVKMME
jgi:hypothetical protein